MWSIKELDCKKKKKREEDNTIELVTFLSNFYLSGESWTFLFFSEGDVYEESFSLTTLHVTVRLLYILLS